MNKEELIINEYYEHINGREIDQTFINLYDANNDKNIYLLKLKKLFAFLHSELNSCLDEFNYRISSSKHFRANDSRDLLYLIDTIFTLQSNLFTTNFSFEISKSYYFYLKQIKPIIRSTNGTEIPDEIESIQLIKYDRIFTLQIEKSKFLKPTVGVDELISLVSTRNAKFDQMTLDEKLGNINEALEHLLKEEKGYLKIDYDSIFNGLIKESDVVNYRKLTHCFRHGSKDSIQSRTLINDKQKLFLVNYGLSLCMALVNHFNK